MEETAAGARRNHGNNERLIYTWSDVLLISKMTDKTIQDFVDFVNRECIGKVIQKAYTLPNFVPAVKIEFNDGSSVEIFGEHDEGFCIDWAEETTTADNNHLDVSNLS